MINKLKVYRKEKGLTQEQLARLLRVSRQTIISIESNRYIPSTLLALKIANYFNLIVEELFLLEKKDLY